MILNSWTTMFLIMLMILNETNAKTIKLATKPNDIKQYKINTFKWEDIQLDPNDTYAHVYNLQAPLAKSNIGEITGPSNIDHSAIAIVFQPSNLGFVVELDGGESSIATLIGSMKPNFNVDKNIAPVTEDKCFINFWSGIMIENETMPNYWTRETYVGMLTIEQVKEYFIWSQNYFKKPSLYNWFTLMNKDQTQIYEDATDCQTFATESIQHMIKKDYNVHFVIKPTRNYIAWNLLDEPTEIAWKDMTLEQKQNCQDFYANMYGPSGVVTKAMNDIHKMIQESEDGDINILSTLEKLYREHLDLNNNQKFTIWNTVPAKGDGVFKFGEVSGEYEFLKLTYEVARGIIDPKKSGFTMNIANINNSIANKRNETTFPIWGAVLITVGSMIILAAICILIYIYAFKKNANEVDNRIYSTIP